MVTMLVSLHMGKLVCDNISDGYHICCHEGSGKSYTMMGASQDEKLKGIIPRLCDTMFAKISEVGVAE